MSTITAGDYVKVLNITSRIKGRQATIDKFAGREGRVNRTGGGWIYVRLPEGMQTFRSSELAVVKKKTPPRLPTPPSARVSPTNRRRVRISEERSKTNAGTLGKTGTVIGSRGKNNMYKVDIEGKLYNFYPKNVEFIEGRGTPKMPSKVSAGSPVNQEAEQIANEILSGINASIKDKVLRALCKRRTSGVKKVRTVTSPSKRTKRRSPTKKPCPSGQERSQKTGRCVKECEPNQFRDPITNRCRAKAVVKKVSSPKIVNLVDEDDAFIPGMTSSFADEQEENIPTANTKDEDDELHIV